MSRIEQALRRSGQWHNASENPEALFESPWSTAEAPVGRPAVADLPRARAAEPDPVLIEPPRPGADTVVNIRRGEPVGTARLPIGLDRLDETTRTRLSVGSASDPALSHQFRRLAATLIHAAGIQPLKSILITSASPGDGKTLTALNLALILSESFDRNVLLVEADLRRPTLARLLGVNVRDGLGDLLKSADDRQPTTLAVTDHLTLLAAGRPNPDPLGELTSGRLQRFLNDAAAQYDWVIVDTPPITAVTDAGLMCPMVDGAVLVIRAGETQFEGVTRAVETLGHDRILGTVLNSSDAEAVGHEAYSTTRQSGGSA